MSDENIHHFLPGNEKRKDSNSSRQCDEQSKRVPPERALKNLLRAIFSDIEFETQVDAQMKQLIMGSQLEEVEADVIKALQIPLVANVFGIQLPLGELIGILETRTA